MQIGRIDFFFTHVGRWEKGKAEESKFKNCSVRNMRFHLVTTWNCMTSRMTQRETAMF
jgi:hypothetical protein